jgi:DNA-binding PadR family transcriptional regulator
MRSAGSRTAFRGEVRLGPGTLYEAIQRLEDAGYIEETSAKEDPENGQLRSAAITA